MKSHEKSKDEKEAIENKEDTTSDANSESKENIDDCSSQTSHEDSIIDEEIQDDIYLKRVSGYNRLHCLTILIFIYFKFMKFVPGIVCFTTFTAITIIGICVVLFIT